MKFTYKHFYKLSNSYGYFTDTSVSFTDIPNGGFVIQQTNDEQRGLVITKLISRLDYDDIQYRTSLSEFTTVIHNLENLDEYKVYFYAARERILFDHNFRFVATVLWDNYVQVLPNVVE